eukprot:CAMPEP_0197449328 /NCGR_PEP_ID=MMETSP1175-20131217/21021_1 /TAXON_ID=1003142 /ORGANISM="Triceratium dubium, Strain CCMP147" /LENGTH=96 /DNA_ID=CAMNT_0042981423 /DNA_START=151 /DNA_END=438 /DNA_ORIENTATION=-
MKAVRSSPSTRDSDDCSSSSRPNAEKRRLHAVYVCPPSWGITQVGEEANTHGEWPRYWQKRSAISAVSLAASSSQLSLSCRRRRVTSNDDLIRPNW